MKNVDDNSKKGWQTFTTQKEENQTVSLEEMINDLASNFISNV